MPQLHPGPVFTAEPSAIVHDGPKAQRLREEVQKNPELEVHVPVVPHKQVAPFVVAPSVFVQTGAAMQRQYKELESHACMEAAALKRRLLLLLIKHPGG